MIKEPEQPAPVALKVTVLGEYFVGKTSIIGRFVGGVFDETYSATIGFSFLSNIWDTSGSERHRAVAPNYYRGTDGCVLVYDLTNPKSLNQLSYWYDEFNSLTEEKDSDEPIPVILIGNKADLQYNDEVEEEAMKFCRKHNIENHFIVSANTGLNVEEAFQSLVSLCQAHQKYEYHAVTITEQPTGKCC